MSVESKVSKDDSKKSITSGSGSPLKGFISERALKKHVKISPSSPTFYEDDTKKGLHVYSSLSRVVVANPLNRHCYLQDTVVNRHYREHGTPSLIWYDYVTNLIQQRAQLTLLRKLFTQKYYTSQFLFKLQQFLNLQQEVYSDVSFYQSHTLNGETSKLPKLNILCKQIVSLLNDLDSCSVHNLLKSLDRSINLSGILHRYQHLYQQITFDLIQCVHNTRQIILNEIKFCYLFANYRSRIYSTVENVIKFNDIVYHPVLVGREDGLAILLEEIVDCNVEMAALYIARSYHHKILSAHFKSVPTGQDTEKISDITSSVQKCQVCMKHGHFLHKYCTNKCGSFLDAMSVMMQGAGENRVACKTDNCSSQYVENLLSRKLLKALYYQASSSVFYENRISCGDKSAVLVHEQFCDQTRKKRRWEDNFTNVIYTCAQRGLPNSWTAASDLGGFEYMVYKLGTSYYSVITCDHAKELKFAQLCSLINKGIEEIFGQIQLGAIKKDINDVLTRHFNKLSYLALSDSSSSKEEIMLLLKYIQHLNQVLRYIFRGYRRALGKFLSTKEYGLLFETIAKLYELSVYLDSLHKQLAVSGELRVPPYLSQCYLKNLGHTKENIELLQEAPDWVLQQLSSPLSSTLSQGLSESLPNVSYWKQDIYETVPSKCAVKIMESVKIVSDASLVLPEPYLTRVHHLLINNTAQLLGKHLVSNKKISFSSSGVMKLESDVHYVLNLVKTTPVSAEDILSSPIVLNLRNDLNALILKRKKPSLKVGCTCNKQIGGNWKRLSAPQLCTQCSFSTHSRSSLKPPEVNARETLSDSEVDADNVSDHFKMRQKKLVKERLEITM
ncbi:uncharacterized protein LOC134822944 [Bolinopsis microptera]|uniref:uncharacterized protein LOC134822944 n=1 Tax=Bolinopsis microptera TaxID=2820187 RepID=UPI00307AF0DB